MLLTSLWRRGAEHEKASESRRKRRANVPNRSRMPRRLRSEPLEQRQLMCVAPVVPDAVDAADVPAIVATAEEAPPLDLAPLAVDNSYAINGRQQLGANVLGNDAYPMGASPLVSLVDGPAHGTLDLGADGSFVYTPESGFDGVDSFTYRFNDGQADSAAATVSISVARANDAPAAAADAFSVDENQVLALDGPGVLANDSDANGDALRAVLATGPQHGTLLLGTDGSLQYTPDAGFTGTDSFTYRANDGQADSEAVAVDITVNAVNAAPTAADDSFTTPQDHPLAVEPGAVLGNDADPDGDPLTAVLVDNPTHGSLVLNEDGSFVYAPDAGFVGTDSFTYMANDGQADSAVATVSITVEAVNAAPTAADDSFTTPHDQPLTVEPGGVLGNDADANGDPLTAVLVDNPAHGSLVLNADGSFVYAPDAGFVGTDSFTYMANDGQADSAVATVSITVESVGPQAAKDLKISLGVSATPFGPDAGPIWSGSTFWVNSYVQDLREVPQGVVGGAIDLAFDAEGLTPTGNVVYGDRFTDYRQGTAGAGVIDEAGALTTEGGVGADGGAAFIAWEFRRSGAGTAEDPNSQVQFAADPGEGTGTILPGNFALVGLGTPVDWQRVEFDAADLNLFLGDFNADGSVNHFDLALWIPQNPSAAGETGFDPRFELTADARVDAADLAVLMPRLYQPVLGATQADVGEDSGTPEPGVQDTDAPAEGRHCHRSRRGGAAAVMAELGQHDRRWWDAGDHDLDWLDSIRERRQQARHDRLAATDRVMQRFDALFSA